MPLLTLPSVTRRGFALASAALGVRLLLAQDRPMHWALLSDTHIPADPADGYRGFSPQENLKKVLPQVAAAAVQGVLICGDLARLKGLPADYAALKAFLAPISAGMPLALALGNHDDRGNFLASFGAQSGAQPVQDHHVVIVDGPAAQFVVLDSLIRPDFVPGLLGKAQRGWLADYLLKATSSKPIVLFVHHPLDDGDGNLLDTPRLLEIIRPHRQVKAVVFGHTHAYAFSSIDGIHLINLPAVGYNFADSEPVGWVEARFAETGVSLTLHAVGGEKSKDGQTTALAWRS
jgi:Icc protein